MILRDRDKVLGDFRHAEPAEYTAWWEDVLAASAIDILALKDSGEHLSCWTEEYRRRWARGSAAAFSE